MGPAEQVQTETYWMCYREDIGMLPIWFDGSEEAGTFSIGEQFSIDPIFTGRYTYDTSSWIFTWYFNAAPENPMTIYPQHAFNWGDDEPNSDWKGSDFLGFYI